MEAKSKHERFVDPILFYLQLLTKMTFNEN